MINTIEKSKPNYVFHLAAQSYPQTSFDAPFETLETNIIGTFNLLEAAKSYWDNIKYIEKNEFKIIHINFFDH